MEQVRISKVFTETYGTIYVTEIYSQVVKGWIPQGEFLNMEDAVKLGRDFNPEFGTDTL